MIVEPRRRKSSSVTFSVPDDNHHFPYYAQRTSSFAESDLDYEPTVTTLSPTAVLMARALRSVKTFKKSWDADKALLSTYKGKVGKYQLRAFIFLALGYAIIVGWLSEIPEYALLMPKFVNCSAIRTSSDNISSTLTVLDTSSMPTKNRNSSTKIQTEINLNKTLSTSDENTYTYSAEYGHTALTDFHQLCSPQYKKITSIVYFIGLIVGGLIFGYIADYGGRKMVLLGSMWTVCVLSVFQLLSEDHISYVFFSVFVGIGIGAVQVVTVPYVIEMFPIRSRAIYGLSLTGIVFLFDTLLPVMAYGLKNWKILQGIISAPLIITSVLYWYTEESMFWYTTQKDYVTAVLSLSRIAKFNGINFEDVFREARDFLRGKRSKGIQCDLHPLLRLEDIKTMQLKYSDFDVVDLQAISEKKNTCGQKLVQVLTGHHYYPTLSTFYPTDFLHSSVLSIYLLVMCGLWLVSSLTEYSLDSPQLTEHITDNFYLAQLYKYLVQIGSIIIVFPMVYKSGRRWPTFFFFLVAEVCLLGSFAIQYDAKDMRTAVLVIYFTGKFASRAGFLTILLYTSEMFPTGLRCTTVGICYMFRLFGVMLASKDVAALNDRMPRLIYGILCLILGSMALLLPETRKLPLPRTIVQVEMIPTSVTRKFRRNRSTANKKKTQSDSTRSEVANNFNDAASSISGVRSVRFGPYDIQSTLHSVYELQEYGQDDTVYSLPGRGTRRVDSRNPTIFQPYSGPSADAYRNPPKPIAEEFDEDFEEGRTHYAPAVHGIADSQQISNLRSEDDTIVPSSTSNIRRSSLNTPVSPPEPTGTNSNVNNRNDSQLSVPSVNEEVKLDENKSQSSANLVDESQTYRPNISEDENYFSEHC